MILMFVSHIMETVGQKTGCSPCSTQIPASYFSVRSDLQAVGKAIASLTSLLCVDDLILFCTIICPSQLGLLMLLIRLSSLLRELGWSPFSCISVYVFFCERVL